MKKFRFRQFAVYQDTLNFQREVKLLSRKYFPKEEQFCLTTQLWRALDSIILNIAEGADRGTDKDFAHFLNIAHTSLNEVVACLDLALNNYYLTEQLHLSHLVAAEKLANQLTAFRKKLLESPSR
ncbi:MAG: 30S ribosomal protein S23 [Parcubacteria group bacterium Greene0416_79]|nr:MAG: 30S ribosomal protein S23 [Parcubacteria group bacterium Greene0416_79]